MDHNQIYLDMQSMAHPLTKYFMANVVMSNKKVYLDLYYVVIPGFPAKGRGALGGAPCFQRWLWGLQP
jgi:hypothetical protein